MPRSIGRSMGKARWLVPLGAVGGGLYLLRRALAAHAEYVDYLRLGDPSGAELPEIELWVSAIGGGGLLLFGAFVAGWAAAMRKRASRR